MVCCKQTIEDYALQTHRLHPLITAWISKFFSNKKHFKISPRIEAKILFYQGKLVWKSNYSLKQSLQMVRNYSNSWWEKKLAILPTNQRFIIDFHLPLYLDALRVTWLWITPWKQLVSGRTARPDNVRKFGNLNIAMTPCFMFLNWQIWGKGIINKPGIHAGNNFDFTKPEGMALYLHEIYHIYQFLRSPRRLLWGYIKALHDSMVNSKILFSHRDIPFELEAIAFEWELISQLEEPTEMNCLSIFKEYV